MLRTRSVAHCRLLLVNLVKISMCANRFKYFLNARSAEEVLDRVGQLYGVEETIQRLATRSPPTRTPAAIEADRRGTGHLGGLDVMSPG